MMTVPFNPFLKDTVVKWDWQFLIFNCRECQCTYYIVIFCEYFFTDNLSFIIYDPLTICINDRPYSVEIYWFGDKLTDLSLYSYIVTVTDSMRISTAPWLMIQYWYELS